MVINGPSSKEGPFSFITIYRMKNGHLEAGGLFLGLQGKQEFRKPFNFLPLKTMQQY